MYRWLLISLCCLASLHSLDVGDRSPGLDGATVVKGGDSISLGGTWSVVEFWATWCGPCRTSIPHLSQLQAQYGETLQIIGISEEDLATVRPFVDGMGEQMSYTVGIAPEHVAIRWMGSVPGIPHAFLVGPDGVIYWQGHPMELDPVLAQMAQGELNAEWLADQQVLGARRAELQQAMQSGDLMRIAQLAEAALQADPTDVEMIQTRSIAARQMGDTGGYVQTWRRVPVDQLDAATANGLAWELLMEVELEFRLVDVAYAMAEHAATLSPDDWSVLETWARALAAVGNFQEAITVSQQALQLAPGTPELIGALQYYQTAYAIQQGTPVPEGDIPAPLPIPPLDDSSPAPTPMATPPTPGGGGVFIP